MISFSPKEQFRKFQSDSVMELAQHAESRWLTIAISTAMAQISFEGATEAELAGARRFISRLLNLHETATETVTYPKRELTSYDAPAKDKEKEKK